MMTCSEFLPACMPSVFKKPPPTFKTYCLAEDRCIVVYCVHGLTVAQVVCKDGSPCLRCSIHRTQMALGLGALGAGG